MLKKGINSTVEFNYKNWDKATLVVNGPISMVHCFIARIHTYTEFCENHPEYVDEIRKLYEKYYQNSKASLYYNDLLDSIERGESE